MCTQNQAGAQLSGQKAVLVANAISMKIVLTVHAALMVHASAPGLLARIGAHHATQYKSALCQRT